MTHDPALILNITLFALLVIVTAVATVNVRAAGRPPAPVDPPADPPPPADPFERARWFVDDGSDGDPTWWARARSFGHDPDLSADDRRTLAADFEPFDRLMTRMFRELDTIGA